MARRWPRFADRGVVLENRFEVTEVGEVLSIASDPTVVDLGHGLQMVFTCLHFDSDPPATMLCEATSQDGGRSWSLPAGALPGELVRGASGTERARLEGAALVDDAETMHLFYSAYSDPDAADPVLGYPADLYRSVSDGSGGFALGTAPVMARTEGGPDHDAIYSPALAQDADGWWMVYAAHCFPRPGVDCPSTPGGVSLQTARAPALGGPWTKGAAPAFEGDAAWMGIFVAEPGVLRVGDTYFLFLSGFNADEKPVTLGMARGQSLEGPWEIYPEPILRAEDVDALYIVAPTAVYDGETLRLFYTWIGDDGLQRIALLEAAFP